MPQVWNPAVSTEQDSGGFSKNSRYMKTSNFSEASMRRIKVRNCLESNLNRIQQAYIRRHSSLSTVKIEQARKNIMERQRRYTAYKLVVKKHPIRERTNYQAALNDNYSLHGLRHELRRMIRDIDPEIRRRRKAESLVQSSRSKYADTVTKNKEAIKDIVPKPKPNYAFDAGDEEEAAELRSPTPPPRQQPQPLRRSIVGPPLRGIAHKAQAVTLQMVKENTWMSGAPSSADKGVRAIAAATVAGGGGGGGGGTNSLSPRDVKTDLNPRAVLPSIQA